MVAKSAFEYEEEHTNICTCRTHKTIVFQQPLFTDQLMSCLLGWFPLKLDAAVPELLHYYTLPLLTVLRVIAVALHFTLVFRPRTASSTVAGYCTSQLTYLYCLIVEEWKLSNNKLDRLDCDPKKLVKVVVSSSVNLEPTARSFGRSWITVSQDMPSDQYNCSCSGPKCLGSQPDWDSKWIWIC